MRKACSAANIAIVEEDFDDFVSRDVSNVRSWEECLRE